MLRRQLRPLLCHPEQELAVFFVLGPGSVPLALASILYAFRDCCQHRYAPRTEPPSPGLGPSTRKSWHRLHAVSCPPSGCASERGTIDLLPVTGRAQTARLSQVYPSESAS